MTSKDRRETADHLVKTFGRWHTGDIDSEEFMGCIESRLRDLSIAEGRDGVLSAPTLYRLGCMARDAYEAQYRMGNVSLTLSAMVFRLRNDDSGDARGP